MTGGIDAALDTLDPTDAFTAGDWHELTADGLVPLAAPGVAGPAAPATEDPQAWRQRAACLGMNPDLFFADRGESVDAALAVCRSCPVRTACLDHALDNHEVFGIWGGTSGRERARIWRDRRAQGDKVLLVNARSGRAG